MLAGCNDMFIPPDASDNGSSDSVPVASDGSDLTQRDYLALTRLTASHTIDMKTLEKMVSGILQISKDEDSARGVAATRTIIGVQKVTSIPSKSFSSGDPAARSAALEPEEPVELYTFEVADPVEETTGYILASNDNRIGNILAIVENGDFDEPENPFTEILHKNLEAYIDTTIAAYATLTDEDVLAALEKLNDREEERALASHWDIVKDYLKRGYVISSTSLSNNFKAVRSPFITTKWNQYAPYSNYVNYGLYKEGKKERTYVAGCVPVALGQLITYYQYMKPISPSVAAFNQPTINGWNPKAGVWTGQYNWAAMKNVSTLTESNTAMVGQIGVLLYQIGKNLGVEYKKEGTTSSPIPPPNESTKQISAPAVMKTLQSMGYNTGNGFQYSTELENRRDGSTIYNYISQSTKKNTLNQGYPYLVYGIDKRGFSDKNLWGGHAWLVDGYGTMTQYAEKLSHPVTGDVKTVTVTLTNCMMVHCNMGNPTGNGWYIDGIFDVGNMASLPGSSVAGKGAPDLSDFVNWMVPTPKR
jgi:hypothetical protein